MSVVPKNREWPYYIAKGLRPKCRQRKCNKFEYFCKYVWCCGWFWSDKVWCSQISSEILVPRHMISFRSMQNIRHEVRGRRHPIKSRSSEGLPVKVQKPKEIKGIVITDPKTPNKCDSHRGKTCKAITFKDTIPRPRSVSNTKPIKYHSRIENDKKIRKEAEIRNQNIKPSHYAKHTCTVKELGCRKNKKDVCKDENRKAPNCAMNSGIIKRNVITVPNNPTTKKYHSHKNNLKHRTDSVTRNNTITIPKCTEKPSLIKERHKIKRAGCCRAAQLESRFQMIFIKCNPVLRRRAISFVSKPSLRTIPAKSSDTSFSSNFEVEGKLSRQIIKQTLKSPITNVLKKIFNSRNRCCEMNDTKNPNCLSEPNDPGSNLKKGNYTCCVLDPRKCRELEKPSTSKVERKSILKMNGDQFPSEDPIQPLQRDGTSQNDMLQTTCSESNKIRVPHNSFKTETCSSEDRVRPKEKPISSRLFGWLADIKFNNEPKRHKNRNYLGEANKKPVGDHVVSKEHITTLYPCSVFNAQLKLNADPPDKLMSRTKDALSFNPTDDPMSTSKSLLPVRKSVVSLKCIFLSDENSLQPTTEPRWNDQSENSKHSRGVIQCRQASVKKVNQPNNPKGKSFLSLFRACLGMKSKRKTSDLNEEGQASVIGSISGRKRFMACDGNTNIRQHNSKPKMMANVISASSNSRLPSSESVLNNKCTKKYDKKPTIFQVMICKLGIKLGYKTDRRTVPSHLESVVSGGTVKVSKIATEPNILRKDGIERPLVIKDSSYVILVEKEIVPCQKISRPGEVIPQKPEEEDAML